MLFLTQRITQIKIEVNSIFYVRIGLIGYIFQNKVWKALE